MYFGQYPVIDYRIVPTEKSTKRVINITVAAKLLETFSDKTRNIYLDYIIRDGERAEDLALRYYNKSDLYWLIWISNQIINPIFEWPFNYIEMTDYLEDQYSGCALFVDCSPGTYAFQRYASNSLLTTEESQFVVGETVTQGSVTGTISEWNPTLRKIVVQDATGDFTEGLPIVSTNKDGTEFQTTLKKYVTLNTDALHHFEDDLGNEMDPYGFISPNFYADGKIYSPENYFLYNNGSPAPLDSNTFPLYTYIIGNNFNNVRTNREYEERLNDNKRNIKILKPEYADLVVQQQSKLFLNG